MIPSVVHVITTFERAGAERLLFSVLRNLSDDFEHHVVVLGGLGALGRVHAAAGGSVEALGSSRPRDFFRTVRYVRRLLRLRQPALVHTWMIHANAVGALASLGGDSTWRLVWSVHHGSLPRDSVPRTTRSLEMLNAKVLRRVPDAVVSTSETAVALRSHHGYLAERLTTIRNGVPSVPDPERRRTELRLRLGFDKATPVVGRVARWSPQKDWPTCVGAFAEIRRSAPESRFVLCGIDIDGNNRELIELLDAHKLGSACTLLGAVDDVASVHAALDVEVSSSAWGETSPLVISEALAVGTPVVATDVGDSRALVGPCGAIVSPGRPDQIAGEALRLLRTDRSARAALRQRARAWHASHLDEETMVAKYRQMYWRLLADGCS